MVSDCVTSELWLFAWTLVFVFALLVEWILVLFGPNCCLRVFCFCMVSDCVTSELWFFAWTLVFCFRIAC